MRLRGSEGGAAVVELAVVVPLLVLLLFGVMEASWYIGNQNEVRDIARQTARIAAATDPTYNSQAISDVVLAGVDLDNVCVEVSGIDESAGYPGALAEVTVQYINPSLTGLIPGLSGAHVGATAQFRVEIPRSELNAAGITRPAWWSNGGSSPCPLW